jgi:hypothetical protein
VEQWIKELKEYSSDPNLCLAIAATKCDLENNRRVPKEKGPQLAKKYQAIHHLTSSKANTGIFEMFEELLTSNYWIILNRHLEKVAGFRTNKLIIRRSEDYS